MHCTVADKDKHDLVLLFCEPWLCRCIIWDLSRSFLLRLAITIFSIILIYTMAQVNVFTCQREKLSSCQPKPSAKILNPPVIYCALLCCSVL